MENNISMLNIKGQFCYGIKLIVKLIEYYSYNYNEWYDFLVCLTDYTLIDFYTESTGRRSEHWSPSEYSPAEILEPVYMPDSNGKDFYPCDICGKSNWLFSENGAESGFCLNFKSCNFVAEHYRYTRPDKNQYSVGKYKKYYDLFMSADINLLRIIYDTVSLTDETSGELFNGNRMPLTEDMLFVYKSLGIEAPDVSGIPQNGFGKYVPCSFDCIELINKTDS